MTIDTHYDIRNMDTVVTFERGAEEIVFIKPNIRVVLVFYAY